MFYNPYYSYYPVYGGFYGPVYSPVVVYRQPVAVFQYGPFGPVFLGYR